MFKSEIPDHSDALPGRPEKMVFRNLHAVLKVPLDDDFEGLSFALFGLGCFWGAERAFWKLDGVYSTAVGYAAGLTPNPNYREVCTGKTGHNEVVRVVFDPKKLSYGALLRTFFESHNPSQGMRQGNDRGTQYRSGIYVYGEKQKEEAMAVRAAYQLELLAKGFGEITTEIVDAPIFYFAEDEHQQYLAKNPGGYCGLGGLGVRCPVGLG